MSRLLIYARFSSQTKTLCLVLVVLALIQIVLVKQIHLIDVQSFQKLRLFEEQRHLLTLAQIELANEVNDIKITQFIEDNNYKVAKDAPPK